MSTEPELPRIGDQVCWRFTVTRFGRIRWINREAQTLLVRVEDSTAYAVLELDKIELLSATGGAA